MTALSKTQWNSDVLRWRVRSTRRGYSRINRQLEAKTRALAGWKGYTTNLTKTSPEFVIDAYHQLWRIEKSFRMSKHDLQEAGLPPQA